MKYVSGVFSDVGIKKQTNEDSVLLQHANTVCGEVVFSVICDGMGGLQKGEVASASVIQACADWFRNSFPELLAGGRLDENGLCQQWKDLIVQQDRKISEYGDRQRCRLGTTLTCVLLIGNQYYIANIGDSRVYLLSDKLYQLTHDHTVVQRDLDNGLLSFEQTLTDPRRSVLLQCIGASDYVMPDFFSGEVKPGQCFLLCCDGFRHVVTPNDMYAALNANAVHHEQEIVAALRKLTELAESRGETDNISAVAIRVG